MFLAAGLLAAEAVATLGYGVLALAGTDRARLFVGVGVSLLFLGYTALLALTAAGVLRGRRWSRGPAVATQLLQLLLGYSFARGVTEVVGVLLIAVAVVVLVCLLLPASTAVFLAEPDGAGPDRAGPDKAGPDRTE